MGVCLLLVVVLVLVVVVVVVRCGWWRNARGFGKCRADDLILRLGMAGLEAFDGPSERLTKPGRLGGTGHGIQGGIVIALALPPQMTRVF